METNKQQRPNAVYQALYKDRGREGEVAWCWPHLKTN